MLSDHRPTPPGGHPAPAPKNELFPGRRMLDVPAAWTPTLLIVIDTEEEFNWRALPDPAARSVENIQHVPLLQEVFDRHGACPAYLVDHPVATTPESVRVLRGFVESGRCEIGAHLHPWVTPPVEEEISLFNSFACNLPPELERRKLEVLTAAITDSFGFAPDIFKAGGYGVGASTAGFLAGLGYAVDTSIVPFTDFSSGSGPNFQDWTGQPFMSAEGIVEIPLTAGFAGVLSWLGPDVFPGIAHTLGRRLHLPGIAARLSLLERLRLTPEGHSLTDMIRLTQAGLARGERLFMMALHSSSMLPGATEYARTESERGEMLARIDAFLRYFRETVGGVLADVSGTARRLAGQPGP